MPTADQANTIAQGLISTGLQQWAKLQAGALNEQTANPTPYINRRPWIDEPDGSVPFDPQGGVAIGNPPPAAQQVVLSMLVPTGYDGVIKAISCNTAFPFNDFSGDLVWRLLQNGRAVRNFDNILAQKGTVQQPRNISPIRIYSGDLVQFVVTHIANVALNGNIICTLGGYFYPSQGVS